MPDKLSGVVRHVSHLRKSLLEDLAQGPGVHVYVSVTALTLPQAPIGLDAVGPGIPERWIGNATFAALFLGNGTHF